LAKRSTLGKRRYNKIVVMTMPTSMARTFARCCSAFSIGNVSTSWPGGYVYVAQPPLFRVRSKKAKLLRANREEMKNQLLEYG